MSRRSLYALSFIYLSLPSVIFLFTWCASWIGVPLAVAVAGGTVWFCRLGTGKVPRAKSIGVVAAIIAVVAVWALVGGIGGYIWQNRWDHMFRNAVFMDLVANPWPVVNGDEMLVYYIGFWLPPALVAKAAGSLAVGWAAQWLYAVGGLLLALWLTFDAAGKVKWRIVMLVMLTGGVDIIGYLAIDGHWGPDDIIENWNELAFMEWPDVMIYWVYNQFIPSWVGCMLAFRLRGGASSVFIMALMLISAPMPTVGLAPLAAYFLWRDVAGARGWLRKLWNLFYPTNLISLAVAIVVGSYLTSNESAGMFGFQDFSSAEAVGEFIKRFAGAVVMGFGVWVPFVWMRVRRDPVFWILTAMVISCMFFTIGCGRDFASRTFLPLSYYMLMRMGQAVCSWSDFRRRTKAAFLTVALLSGCSPIDELYRITYYSLKLPAAEWRYITFHTVFDAYALRENFVGPAHCWPFSK